MDDGRWTIEHLNGTSSIVHVKSSLNWLFSDTFAFFPWRPADNPFIESFNGSFRDKCLNTNWFLSLEDARDKIESFLRDYNEFRPHRHHDDHHGRDAHLFQENKADLNLLFN